MKKHVAATFAALILIFPITLLGASSSQHLEYTQAVETIDQTLIPQPKDTRYIIASTSADVTGDGVADLINLTASKQKPDDRFASNMALVIRDGQTDQTLALDLNMGGYEGKLFVGDFTGDHIADIMVSAPTGGSGGVVDNRIAVCSGDQLVLIFDRQQNKGASFTGQFLDGWKTEITNTDTGKTITINAGQGRTDYIRLGIYDETGTAVKANIKPWGYPFSVLAPTDPDNDGVYELKGYQRIVGAYNADPLAEAETQWKYEDGQWVMRQLKVSVNFLNNPIRPIK